MIFIILFVLYSYTSLFTGKSPNNDKPDDNINFNKGDFDYDYVKSRKTKTKISFPVDKTLKSVNSDDFYKLYKNDNNAFLEVKISSLSDFSPNYSDESFNAFKASNSEYRVERNSINCNYMCERYSAYKQDNSLFVDEFRLFVDLSSNERFELKYHFEDKELSNDFINSVYRSIDFVNDVTNTIGKVIDNKLYIDFENVNNQGVSFSVDSNIYEEIINLNNNKYSTSLRNKNNNTVVDVSIIFKESNEKFDDIINKMYNEQGKKVKPEKEYIDVNILFEYAFGKRLVYAYIIDENAALLFDSKDGQIFINDFYRIVIIDV